MSLHFAPTAHAAQTIPYKINFQGRLTDGNGNIKPDGLYNMKIRIYSALTNGTLLATETRDGSFRVQVTNGLFSIQIGDNSTLSPSIFTQYPLYLEVELPTPATANCTTTGCATWTEGPMSPRSPLGSSPYAFNADTVDGIDGSNLAQLNGTNQFTGSNQYVNGITMSQNSGTLGNLSYSGGSYFLQNAGAGSFFYTSAEGLNIASSKQGAAGSAVNVIGFEALQVRSVNDSIRSAVDNGVTYGDNLISNPGFEFGCAGWTACAAGFISTASPASGLSNYRFVQTAANSSFSTESRLIAAQPGDQFYLSAAKKVSATTAGTAGLYLKFLDANGNYITVASGDTANPGTSYVTKGSTLTVPAGTAYMVLGINIAGTGSTAGTWDFDNIYLKKVNQTAPQYFQSDSNSTTAFQIQDASGNQLFVADSTNNALLVGSGDVTPAANPTLLVLDSKNTAGDPTGRAGAMYYNSVLGKNRCFNAGVWRNCNDNTVYANTSIPTGNTVANTTTETNFASNYTIPANDCQPGRVYQVKAQGVYSSPTTAPALTMRVKIGSVVVGLPTNTAVIGSQTNQLWVIDFTITCDSTGTTGTIEGQGEAKRYSGGNAVTLAPMVNTAIKNIDTTVAQTLQISAQFNSASTSNTITLRQLTVTPFGPN